MGKSIDWERNVINVDFQKAESQENSNPQFRNILLDAIAITDDEWELEWSFIRKYLKPDEIKITEMIMEGYTQKDISYEIKVERSNISRKWQKIQDKIKKIHK